MFILCAPNLVDTPDNIHDVVYIWVGKSAHPRYVDQWVALAQSRVLQLQTYEHVSKKVVILQEGSEVFEFILILINTAGSFL